MKVDERWPAHEGCPIEYLQQSISLFVSTSEICHGINTRVEPNGANRDAPVFQVNLGWLSGCLVALVKTQRLNVLAPAVKRTSIVNVAQSSHVVVSRTRQKASGKGGQRGSASDVLVFLGVVD